MTCTRFDDTAKAVARSRRTALKSGAAFTLGGVLTALLPQTARPGKRKRRLKPTYSCADPPPFETTLARTATTRWAQSFTATRSGMLRKIKVGVYKLSGSPGDFIVEVVRMNGAVPSNSPQDVIAAKAVPSDQVKSGQVMMTATFNPTPLTQGTTYAVVVSRVSTHPIIGARVGDVCGGELFSADGAGTFEKLSPVHEMVVTVLVR